MFYSAGETRSRDISRGPPSKVLLTLILVEGSTVCLHRDTCKDLCRSYTVYYRYNQRISVLSNIDFIHNNTGLCSHIVPRAILKEDTV